MLHIEERILVSEVAKIKRAKEEKKTSGAATTTENAPKEPTSPDTATSPAGGQPTGQLGQGTPNVAEAPSTEDEAYYAALEAGHATATPTNPSAEAPVTPSWGDGGEAFSTLYPKERLIAQQLIRHGEKVMFIDEETHQPVTVTEFVASEFDMDKIAFTTPLFAEVLDELRAHASEPNFVAERYFIAHHNPALSRLAVDLIEEKYQLSKYHSKTQTVLSEVDRLAEIVMHLMDDYKNSLVEQQIKDALNQLRQPEVMSDPDKCLEVMSRYKGLIELKQYMAKRLGDRVISN